MTDNPHDGSQHPRHTPEPWTVFKDEYGIPVQTRFYIKKGAATICAMNTPCLLYAKGEKDANRIVACVNAFAGVQDPAAEIEKLKQLSYLYAQAVLTAGELRDQNTELRAKVSVENLHKIFSEHYQVNEYRGGWVGDWPEMHFFLHEIWKRDPNVDKLRANQQVLVDALENLLEDLEEYLPDLSRKERYELVGVAREALNKVKESENVES